MTMPNVASLRRRLRADQPAPADGNRAAIYSHLAMLARLHSDLAVDMAADMRGGEDGEDTVIAVLLHRWTAQVLALHAMEVATAQPVEVAA